MFFIARIFNFRFDRKLDISTFISQLESTVHRANAIEEDKTTGDMLISKIIFTLPENYNSFIGA